MPCPCAGTAGGRIPRRSCPSPRSTRRQGPTAPPTPLRRNRRCESRRPPSRTAVWPLVAEGEEASALWPMTVTTTEIVAAAPAPVVFQRQALLAHFLEGQDPKTRQEYGRALTGFVAFAAASYELTLPAERVLEDWL